MVTEALLELDPIVYVCFTFIYKDFCETTDFEKLIGKVEGV